MGRFIAKLVILCAIVLIVMAADANARIEGRWALQTGDITVGEDISIQKPMAAIFHQQTAEMSDIEQLDIAFPIFSDDLQLGPTTGIAAADDTFLSEGTANVLPFGPVNLAFPSVDQSVAQHVLTTDTGFFTANWAYIADTAAGNLGAEPIGAFLGSGHPNKSPKMLGSEFVWPLMVPAPKAMASTGSTIFDMSGMRSIPLDFNMGSILDQTPVYHTPKVSFYIKNNTTAADNATIGINNTAVSQATQNNTTSRPATPTRKPRVNPKATKEEIKNLTTLQRTYRNAFVGTTMHKAYEGPTQYPTAINPYDNGKGVFNQIDMQKILQVAMKKTRAGEHIAPVFWDL